MKIKIKTELEILRLMKDRVVTGLGFRGRGLFFSFEMLKHCGKVLDADQINPDGRAFTGCLEWLPKWYDRVEDKDTPPDGYRMVTEMEIETTRQHPDAMFWSKIFDGWSKIAYPEAWYKEETYCIPVGVVLESNATEMTVADVSAALGYEVKIVKD